MKLVFLVCFLVGCSVAKISPFIPGDITKHHVDVARAEYVKGKMVAAQAVKAEQIEAKALENIAEEMSQATDEPNVPEEKSDVVPIVVGSVMGGIIVVVLVSYFIVRARRAKE
eukprot:TRINITY_DN3024_c0_g1_i1.p1 TRINITY_DN3024_c0_g1~~TRINITY_DN3024_c0_g1_i1.p1  ORF type:complete len:127 (+),score=55.48 TRINITY_DN3024_c0_g1_i1:45-383(+)